MLLILCADAKCPSCKQCLRFTTDPIAQIQNKQKVRIESSFRVPGFSECKKFIQIKEQSYEINF